MGVGAGAGARVGLGVGEGLGGDVGVGVGVGVGIGVGVGLGLGVGVVDLGVRATSKRRSGSGERGGTLVNGTEGSAEIRRPIDTAIIAALGSDHFGGKFIDVS